MNLPHPLRLGVAPLLLLAVSLAAAEKLDLDRTAPVPATEPIPVQDFFRPLVLQQPALNPSGTHVAALVTAAEDKHQLLVYDLKTQKIEVAGATGDRDIYDFNWLGDKRLVFSLGSRKLYGLGLLATEVGSLINVYPLLQYSGARIVSIPLQDRLRPLIWNTSDIDTGRDLGVSVINTDIRSGNLVDFSAASTNGSAAFVEVRENNDKHTLKTFPVPRSGITYRYLADKSGQLAYSFSSDNGVLIPERLEASQWVKCPVDLEEIDIVDSGNQPGQLLVVGPRQEGKPRALQLLEAASGHLGEVLLQDQAYDFNGWIYRHPGTGDILGAAFDRNGPRMFWFNEEYKGLQKVLEGFFPGLVVRIHGSDLAQKIFLVATYSDRQPVIYNWVDLEKKTVGLIKNSAPWIDPKRMQPMSIIKFKTRDGHSLDAYVTLPAGASKANPPPLVVLAHGGPWVRDNWGFNGEVQFLASRGYAVMQPNYRGSTGINWMFPKEDEWDFRKMHDDVTDATQAMVASGLVDKNRIAIMGGSFGGYLAVSGVVHEPSLYRCAVTIAGVFDWELQVQSKKYGQAYSPVYGRLVRKLGDPKKEPDKFAAISPGRYVDRIKVPVFVSGGKDDSVVELEQSKRLLAELDRHHVPHEKYLVGGEGHGMAYLQNQVELYARIEAFLAKNLLPKPAS